MPSKPVPPNSPGTTKQESRVVFPYPDDFFDDDLPNGVLSPSGISRWRNCPKQFEYAYVLGIKSPPGIAAAKGKAIHSGAEFVHNHTIKHGELIAFEEAKAHVADRFDAEIEEVPSEVKDEDPTPVGVYKDVTLNNFGVYFVSAVPHIRPVAVEKPFAVKIGVVPVRGIIDLIDQEPGDYTLDDDPDAPPPDIEVVSDLKTTKKRWTDQQVEHAVPMTIYAIAENAEKIRIDLLLDLKKGCQYTALRALRSEREKRIVTEDVEQIADAIKKGIFPRCDPTSWVCTPKWCGYYGDCRGPK